MQSTAPATSEKSELSITDIIHLEQKIHTIMSPKKRKQELKMFTENFLTKKTNKQVEGETVSTPKKMKCHVTEEIVTTPRGTRYTIGEKLGEGGSGKVYACYASNHSKIALKKQSQFRVNLHKEIKKAAELAQKIYHYGAYFCPKQSEDLDCKDLPHYLTMPHFLGKDPEQTLEDHCDTIFEKNNEGSLAIFGLLKICIVVAKAYKDFSEQHRLVHGDPKSENIQLILSKDEKQLQAVIIDFDNTQEIGELTCGEAALYQGKELHEKIPADPLSDVYSVGFLYNDMVICLIEKEIYHSREKNNTTDRGTLNPFFQEMDALESLIERMMLNESKDSYKERPSFATVLTNLNIIFESAQNKFIQGESNDFNETLLLQGIGQKKVASPSTSTSTSFLYRAASPNLLLFDQKETLSLSNLSQTTLSLSTIT